MPSSNPVSRRRFLTISAAALVASPAVAMTEWKGMVLGARARILIDHPDAAQVATDVAAEIARLESIFSLYTDSALTRLNRDGQLDAPPFELLECLALCDGVYNATDGLFDPTVQPLWALYAESYSAGRVPEAVELARRLRAVGWQKLSFDPRRITLQTGQALTLNGVAQGFIADRVAVLLQERGLTDILIDTGELRALGNQPDGAPWPVKLTVGGQVALQDRAMASSSALGTTFDDAGRVGHILSPTTGLPAPSRWSLVTITAPSAGLADALSTAACLMGSRSQIETALAGFDGARLEHLA